MADPNGPVLCPAGHANPAGATHCQTCGLPLQPPTQGAPTYPPPGAPVAQPGGWSTGPSPTATAPPAAGPTTTAPPAAGPTGRPAVDPVLLAGFTATLRTRPPLSIVGVLAANAGALFAAAAIALLAQISDEPGRGLLIGWGLGLIVVGWVVAAALTLVAHKHLGGRMAEFVPGATIMAAVGVFIFVIGLANPGEDGLFGSENVLWWPYLVAGLVLLILWALPGLQGRPFLLGAALLSFIWSVTAFVGVQVAQNSSSRYNDPFRSGFFGIDLNEVVTSAAAAALVAGMVCLLAVIVADRFGLRGIATPFLVAGVIGSMLGAYGVVREAKVLPALLLTVVIVVVIAVGALGGRKATTWIGALAFTPAVLQLIAVVLGSDVDPVPFLLLALVAGVVVTAVAVALFVWGPSVGQTLDARLPGERRVTPGRSVVRSSARPDRLNP